ncbi:GM18804 [Drosophila sechellia]|uniref:GM18797 n=1 Tax=Drosophila sechellia TaxID=7238 RepID=B4ILL9_DROSE|nr:GM18797 [Drosophila sechellia]EDW54700.1 GM18804 [Drosophila sechellia]
MALCLKTFIKGLTVPLRNVVKASRPNTLDEAFDIAIQERDEYVQERRRYPANQHNNRISDYQQGRGQYRALPYSTENRYGQRHRSNNEGNGL